MNLYLQSLESDVYLATTKKLNQSNDKSLEANAKATNALKLALNDDSL